MRFIFSIMSGTTSRMSCINSLGCETGVRNVPSATTALSRFEPMTAPKPHLPAALACAPSLIMFANGISCSPAGPMQTSAALLPYCRVRRSKVS